jgi:hypothetical protein
VLWPSAEAQNSWHTFREPGQGEARTIDEIPLAELRVLAQIARRTQTDPEAALRQMAKLCRINRVGENVRARIQLALD